MENVFTSRSLADTKQFAEKIIATLDTSSAGATILALSGDLGSGKTAFVKALAGALGIKETITSPTFVIEQIYMLPKTSIGAVGTAAPFDRLIHIDAYRLERASELEHLGWAEIATNPRNLICLEWPENVVGLTGLDSKQSNVRILRFHFVDENTREISSE